MAKKRALTTEFGRLGDTPALWQADDRSRPGVLGVTAACLGLRGTLAVVKTRFLAILRSIPRSTPPHPASTRIPRAKRSRNEKRGRHSAGPVTRGAS